MSQPEDEKLGHFLDDTLAKGYIVLSKSPMVSLVFFIKKKDGKLRFMQNYRKLNAITIKNHYLLLLTSDIINRLTKAKIFTKFDVRWRYNNIRIKEADQWKAAFITNYGSFEHCIIYFGLTNSPATFQTLMNMIFADLIAEGKVAVYMDNILIYSADEVMHREMIHEVLRRLEEYDLYLKPEKCEFDCDRIKYLGIIIKNFSAKACPLNDLTKKDMPWRWKTDEEAAFAILKQAFAEAPVLALYDSNQPTEVKVNMSNFATRGVLSQKGDNGLWHLIAYRSEMMSTPERNYKIYNKEFMAIVRVLED